MSNRAKLFIPAAFFVVMMGLLFYGLGQDPTRVPSAMLNRPLPQFTLPDMLDPATTVSSDQLKGKVTLVNFWGTWCPPCHAEHPYLVEISKREKDIAFIGINFDEQSPESAPEFLQERGNPFQHVVVDADGRLRIDFGVAGAPETYLVDKTGMIRYKHVGEINDRVWDEIFVPLLAQLDAESR